MAGRRKSLEERFWAKVRKLGPEECWEWQARRTDAGYGQIGAGARSEGLLYAHRLSYRLATGTDPGESLVCHRCDNPPCVNPAHLFLGSSRDNSRDARDKNRIILPEVTRGEDNNKAKITDAQAREIYRRRALEREPLPNLVQEFNLTPASIWNIATRRTWQHIHTKEEAA